MKDDQSRRPTSAGQGNRSKAPYLNPYEECIQTHIEASLRDSRSVPAILEVLQSITTEERYRNEMFRTCSSGYNVSLEDGKFEMAVIYLMLMRLVLKEESAINDARTLSEIAIKILTCTKG